MPEYQLSQKVSGVQSSGGNSGVNKGGGGGGGPRKGCRNNGSIYNSQGKIHTVYYHHCKGFREEDRKTNMAARKKNVSKFSHTASKKDVSYTKRQISELSSTLTEIKASITDFSRKPRGLVLVKPTVANNIPSQGTSSIPFEYAPPNSPRIDLQAP